MSTAIVPTQIAMADGGTIATQRAPTGANASAGGVQRGGAAAPLRVAFDACCFVGNPTGIANYVRRLLDGMRAAHPEVQFFGYSNDAPLLENAANLVVRVSTPRRKGPFWQNTQVVDMLRDDAIDVYWGTNGVVPLRPTRAATVVTVHDLAHRFVPETQLRNIRWKQRIFQRLSARAADRVVAVSSATADDMARHYGRRADVVLHPLAAAWFRRPPATSAALVVAGRTLPESFLLSVATQEPRKNLLALVEAFDRCTRAGLALPPLVLAGGRGWFDGPLRAILEPAIAAGRVVDLGYVDNAALVDLYARCTMFVLPSLYEGFGMPLLEAQACGAPVLHGTHASMVEASGGIGVAVDPTVEGIADALAAFARDELPLACRLLTSDANDADIAAERMWNVIVEAWRAKVGGMREAR